MRRTMELLSTSQIWHASTILSVYSYWWNFQNWAITYATTCYAQFVLILITRDHVHSQYLCRTLCLQWALLDHYHTVYIASLFVRCFSRRTVCMYADKHISNALRILEAIHQFGRCEVDNIILLSRARIWSWQWWGKMFNVISDGRIRSIEIQV